ncbi:unnamed protein product [Rotaria magnacalcarata]|uniref:Uncharacterized protein n=2 Tax=Rotaria magnacalcarata TaxID=392030 RepID=A0A8S2LNM0_9BILA|nr:unnamed protein product [Rotaria magnacalcarata]CAF3899575.1 unnamed protein product [Rotaria magnacalcarata]
MYDLNLDIPTLEEALKTKILFDQSPDQILGNDSPSFNVEEMDTIIGRTYSTRGVKRSYEEDPILVEPNKNRHRQNKMIEDQRDLLHLQDTYHLTGCAFNAIFQFIRTIFVARKYESKLEQFDILNIRFNMDGTLIGNKHIVATSINSIEGDEPCQTSKNLVPLGVFEVQKENTKLLRKILPVEFINDIKSVKHISV